MSMSAAIANTRVTTGANNIREDLANVVYQIDPWETPLVGAIGSVEAEAVTTEWLVQELAAAGTNIQPEGFRYAAQAATAPARMNNVCQIMVRAITVSRTFGAVNSVGGDEFDRQALLKGKELRRDLEYTITRAAIRTTVDPRRMSGLQTYITNGSMGAGAGAMPTGDGSNAPTAGTPRAMTLDLINAGLEQAFQDGGHPNLGLMGTSLKKAFSALSMGGTGNAIAATNIVTATDSAPVSIVSAVDVFLSDFGRIQLAPDLFMPTTLFLGVDTNYVELAPLPDSDMIMEEYAKTGDARDGAMLFEGSLRVTAPKAHMMVGDLT